ncbi:MAG: radical SAM protein [Deltaproteobacteria bacterium]|nr:radical SAM protein [Deltaproteobacteria bacterium]
MLPKLLFATPAGTVLEHPNLLAIGRAGDDLLAPAEPPVALPPHGKLVHLPGRRPVGFNPETGAVEVLGRTSAGVGRRTFTPDAVAAVLPPGWTRTFLPATRRDSGPPLPQWAYAASGWGERGPVVWAMRTDQRNHWDPSRFSTPDLERRVAGLLAELPGNRVLTQLQRCALEYRCFTAQNIFYERDEGGLPGSTGCNARCQGCISQSRPGGPKASMERIPAPPSAEELAEIGARHLARARGRVMVSFGQGCEGEPLTRATVLAKAIGLMRRRTGRGSVNINTNGSLTEGLDALLGAGLDAVRVSLNSAHPDLYEAYYRPQGYGLRNVERSIALARRRKAYIALNLLILPGVTDRAGEVDRLSRLIVKHRVDQLQARSLCIDADDYVKLARGVGAGGAPMGVRAMLCALRRAAPWLVVGNFARGICERRKNDGSDLPRNEASPSQR